jgi:hypothetical protein
MNQESISTKLSELFELRKSGAITEEEYILLKSQIINAEENKESIESRKIIPPATENERVIEPSDNNHDKNGIVSGSKKKIYVLMMIATIILIVMVAIFFVTSKKSDQDTGQVNQLNRSKDNTSANSTPIAKDKTSTWDEPAATKIVMDELSKYPNWSKIPHEIVGFTKISLSNKDLMVAVTKSNNDYLSLFEFEDRNGWKLKKKCFAFNSSIDKANLYKIASNNYGLMTIRYEGSAGSSGEHKQLFAFIYGNEEFKQIFDTPEDLKFITKINGYYDIEATPKGGQPELYKFNGSEYVQQ